jgi:photosystem II stability/assembly factor-like uncharacterized protein
MKKAIFKTAFTVLSMIVLTGMYGLHSGCQAQGPLPEYVFGDLKARQIGPASMSGRISAIDAVDNDPAIMYAGTASGGLWKTINWGTSFKPVFDKYIQSIGAITIDQEHPDTVWVGTGEVWVRNSTSVGDGIYKTTNGGETWTHMGLEKTERIAKIVIQPGKPDVIYVAALGNLWNPGPDRGLYKSSDGGKTWEKILYVDENTGCSDVAVDPQDPRIIYAGMWEFRRTPWSFNSGGPGSGLFRSADGGKTWDRLTRNLPEGIFGRVALAISPPDPDIVYALIEAKNTGLYRSRDKGLTWEMMTESQTITDRPFYFSNLIPDPLDTNIIYKPGFEIFKSTDEGRTFGNPAVEGGNYHSDCHVLYISHKDHSFMYMGTDGGVYVSMDKGNTWRLLRDLPVPQYYHVSTDNDSPFNVYGGLQDNGSWYGPSQAGGGITNNDWKSVGFGDGFYVYRDKLDPNILYWQYQGGYVARYYKNSGEYKSLIPLRDKETKDLRFNWNAPLIFSPTGNTMYIGAQYLYKTNNRGDTWIRISPDLTTDNQEQQKQEKSGGLTVDNSSAENHCTIYTINESPLDSLIIWAGTDDGNLQVTTDGGKTWVNTSGNISGLPANTWCSYVEPGRFDRNSVYATFDGHRTGDKTPYVFYSSDLGKTWVPLADTAIKAYCHVIKQDLVNPGLLYLGTEGGLYLSIDKGKSWTRFTGNVPKAPVMDIAIHPREQSLILATHGRGIIIIDDLTPIREMTPGLAAADVQFLPSKEYMVRDVPGAQRFDGDDGFVGQTAPREATIVYYLKDRHVFGDMKLAVYDQSGKMVKELPLGIRKGINVVKWSATLKPPKVPVSPQPEGYSMTGPHASPGIYTVKLTLNGKEYTSKVNIVTDPGSPYSVQDREVRQNAVMKAYDLLETLAYMDRQISDIRAGALKEKGEVSQPLSSALDSLAARMDSLNGKIVALQVGKITGEERLREKVAFIYGSIQDYQGRPTDSQLTGLNELAAQVETVSSALNNIESTELVRVNNELRTAGKKEITITSREVFMREP